MRARTPAAGALPAAAPAAAGARLARELARALEVRRPGTSLVRFTRTPRPCRSSWALEDLVLHLDDGSSVPLLWKDLGREAPGSRSRTVKPSRVVDPRREPWMYRSLLPRLSEGPPCWGTVSDGAAGLRWVFLEPVPGVPLCEVGEGKAWTAAAAWLGRFHVRARRLLPGGGAPLLRHDPSLHRWWYRRAVGLARSDAEGRGGSRRREAAGRRLRALRDLEAPHRQAVDQVLATPPSLLHGEFYPANILVVGPPSAPSVVPVDWEMAAVGPPALDLAALGSGDWGDGDRAAFARAYREGALAAGGECPAPDELARLVDAARLLLAVQWLGWAADGWRPPTELRNDWLREAEASADRVNQWCA